MKILYLICCIPIDFVNPKACGHKGMHVDTRLCTNVHSALNNVHSALNKSLCICSTQRLTDKYKYIYRKRKKFCWGLIFVGKLPHENLYTRTINNSNYGGPVLPTKLIPTKI